MSYHSFPRIDHSESRPDATAHLEELVPRMAHFRNTLKSLSFNRWEDRCRNRSGSQWNTTAASKLQELRQFHRLETLRLDPPAYCYPRVRIIPPSPESHHGILDCLPRSLKRLILPGAPWSLEDTLYELASLVEQGEFPQLEYVAVIFGDGYRNVWKEPYQHEPIVKPPGELDDVEWSHFLHQSCPDLLKTFISGQRRIALENTFHHVGMWLCHVDPAERDYSWRDANRNGSDEQGITSHFEDQ